MSPCLTEHVLRDCDADTSVCLACGHTTTRVATFGFLADVLADCISSFVDSRTGLVDQYAAAAYILSPDSGLTVQATP